MIPCVRSIPRSSRAGRLVAEALFRRLVRGDTTGTGRTGHGGRGLLVTGTQLVSTADERTAASVGGRFR